MSSNSTRQFVHFIKYISGFLNINSIYFFHRVNRCHSSGVGSSLQSFWIKYKLVNTNVKKYITPETSLSKSAFLKRRRLVSSSLIWPGWSIRAQLHSQVSAEYILPRLLPGTLQVPGALQGVFQMIHFQLNLNCLWYSLPWTCSWR